MSPISQLPPAPPTLLGLIERTLANNGPRVALIGDERRLTYAELDRAATTAAHRLREAGVCPGDHVALLIANGLSFPIYDIGLLRAGGVKVPLNDLLSADDIGAILSFCNAPVVVVSESLMDLAQRAIEAHGPATRIIPAGKLTELCDGEPKPPVKLTREPADCAAVFFTGGTSGRPKAVMHSQAAMAANMLSTIIESEIGRDERLLLTTPLPHAAGLFTMAALIRGATTVIQPGFDIDAVLDALEAERITWTFMVPTMIYRILDHPRLPAAEHSALRTIQYGAAPIDPGRLAAALNAFGPAFIQLYGQTEVPNFATTLTKADHVRGTREPELLLSCGRAVTMCDVSIRDEQDGSELPRGEIGEVCVRSPYTMTGYLDDPGGAAARFHGDWLRTGDIAAMDDTGYVFLKDRRSDMVISGGMNVYTAEVERIVAQAPGVRQAAVIGVPDPDWGEAVHAVVVTVGGEPLEPEAVIAFCRGRLAGYMRPKSVEVVAEMPLTAYGKVDKKQLRAGRWTGRERHIS